MKALALNDIMTAFDLIDRAAVVAPDLRWVPWPDLDYFAWKHPTEAKAFLVADLPERPVGLVLRTRATRRSGFCDLCCGIDREAGSSLMLVDSWQQPRTSLGIQICAGLDCSDSARGLKWIYRMGETITVGRRVERLQENLEAFVRRVTNLAGTPLAQAQG